MFFDYLPYFCLLLFGTSFILMLIEYYWIYFPLKKHQDFFQNENLPHLSVVICAKNEALNIHQNLEKVLQQDYPNFEVIVVNDASTDATLEMLTNLSSQYQNLRVVNIVESNGKKNALKKGISEALNEYLVLTDADCVPVSNQWLKYYGSAYAQGKKIILGYGAYSSNHSFLNKLIRYDTLLIALRYMGLSQLGFPYMGVGRNLGYHRSLVELSKGLDIHQDLRSGDDDLFIQKAVKFENTHILISVNSFTLSEPKNNFFDFFNQKTRHLTTGIRYTFPTQVILFIFMLRHFLMHTSWILLLILGKFKIAVILFFFISISQYLINRSIFSNFREKGLAKYAVLLDIFYTFVTITTAIRSMGFSKKRWN